MNDTRLTLISDPTQHQRRFQSETRRTSSIEGGPSMARGHAGSVHAQQTQDQRTHGSIETRVGRRPLHGGNANVES